MTRYDRPLPAVCAIQLQRGGRGLGGDQRIDHDDSGVAFDEADVRQVEAADLIDALDHFVEALLGAQLALPPQAGMHRRRRVAADECVGVVVPHHATVGGLDDAWALSGNESPVGVVEVGGVVERQIVPMVAVRGFDGGGGRLLVHDADIATNS